VCAGTQPLDLIDRQSSSFTEAMISDPVVKQRVDSSPGRDTLIGPGLATWDFSAFKTTNLRERLALQFRAEIFNLLNRANFNTPNLITFTSSSSGTKVSGTAGAITGTSTTSRQIQFGLKLIW
jgi:hypothetical protein